MSKLAPWASEEDVSVVNSSKVDEPFEKEVLLTETVFEAVGVMMIGLYPCCVTTPFEITFDF